MRFFGVGESQLVTDLSDLIANQTIRHLQLI